MRRLRAGLAAAAAVMALAACDQFSLFDELASIAEGGLRVFPNSLLILVNKDYNFGAIGGTPPYSWTVSGSGSIATVAGSEATGSYTAGPTPGTDVVRLQDAEGRSVEAEVHVSAETYLVIEPPGIIIDKDTEYPFSARGGTTPYTFSLVSGVGSITPAGVYASPNTGNAVVRVTDAAGSRSDGSVVVVAPGPLGISPPTITVAQGETVNFSAYGGDGSHSYSFTVSSGPGSILPSGLYTAIGASAGDTATVRVMEGLDQAQATVTIAPAAPSGLVADGSYGSPSEVLLTWTDRSIGEDGFLVERAEVSVGVFGQIDTVPGSAVVNDTISYVDGTGSPSETYVYRVRAYKGTLMSDYSNLVFTDTK